VKHRLDQALVDRGLCESRTRAQRLIMAGQVRINGQVGRKAGESVALDSVLEVVHGERFASRGGGKLEHALVHFGLEATGCRALDMGASTGGFTDCLLQRGAARVWAVDVGQGQLIWRLRTDPRVVVMEKTNARHLTPTSFGPGFVPFDLICIDCSFISLRLILPAAWGLLASGGSVVALIKPQFEAGREEVDRGEGVITDPAIHSRVISELEAFVAREASGVRWRGVTESPLPGPAGNREFLVWLESKEVREALSVETGSL
jgi:23S rRNA (cytidine1920-2'-O)/16S rRNA (cytidine1409-2'-O)-methyltransferase